MANLQTIYTKNGDVADQISQLYYGQESSVVDLYNDNPHLIHYGAVLRGSLAVNVPRQQVQDAAPSAVKLRLW